MLKLSNAPLRYDKSVITFSVDMVLKIIVPWVTNWVQPPASSSMTFHAQ